MRMESHKLGYHIIGLLVSVSDERILIYHAWRRWKLDLGIALGGWARRGNW